MYLANSRERIMKNTTASTKPMSNAKKFSFMKKFEEDLEAMHRKTGRTDWGKMRSELFAKTSLAQK